MVVTRYLRRLFPSVAALVVLVVLPACRRIPENTLPHGDVVRVIDGDTIEVLVEKQPLRVRLHGIDCPERGQPYGRVAQEFTADLAFRKIVTLHTHGQDRYGRTVAEVELPDGRLLGNELVRAGLAWWYQRYAPTEGELERFEAEAKAAKIGLWADPNPIPPWDWRASRHARPAKR